MRSRGSLDAAGIALDTHSLGHSTLADPLSLRSPAADPALVFRRFLLLGVLLMLQHAASVGVFYLASPIWAAAFAVLSAAVLALALWRAVFFSTRRPPSSAGSPSLSPATSSSSSSSSSLRPLVGDASTPSFVSRPAAIPELEDKEVRVKHPAVSVPPSPSKLREDPLEASNRDVMSLAKAVLALLLCLSLVSSPLLGLAISGESSSSACQQVTASQLAVAVGAGANCFEFARVPDRPLALDDLVCATTASGVAYTLPRGSTAPASSETSYFVAAVVSELDPSTILFWYTSRAPLSVGLTSFVESPRRGSQVPQADVSLYTGAVARCSAAYSAKGKTVSPPVYVTLSSDSSTPDYRAMLGASAALLAIELASWYTLLAASVYFLLSRPVEARSPPLSPQAAAAYSAPETSPVVARPFPLSTSSDSEGGADSDCKIGALPLSALRGLAILRRSDLRARDWVS